jgi:hypothetical protein
LIGAESRQPGPGKIVRRLFDQFHEFCGIRKTAGPHNGIGQNPSRGMARNRDPQKPLAALSSDRSENADHSTPA